MIKMIWVINLKFDDVVFRGFLKTSFYYLVAKCFDHFWANFGLSFTDIDATQIFLEEVVNKISF